MLEEKICEAIARNKRQSKPVGTQAGEFVCREIEYLR